MINILRKNGYSLVKNPSANIKPLQLILKDSNGNAEQLNSDIVELFTPTIYPIPLVSDEVSMFDTGFIKEEIQLDVESHSNLLSNLLKLVMQECHLFSIPTFQVLWVAN